MQGEQGSMRSSLEASNFECGSALSAVALDAQERCTAGINYHAESEIQALNSSSHLNDFTNMNIVSQQQQTFSNWILGEASSSGTKSEADEDLSLSSKSLATLEASESDSSYPNPISLQCSNHRTCALDINLNEDLSHYEEDTCTQILELSDSQRSSGLSFKRDISLGESSDGCHLLCKRKAIDINGEASSSTASSAPLQCGENSIRPTYPSPCDLENVSCTSAPSADANMEHVSQIPGFSVPTVADSPQRNCRVRLNPSNQRQPTNMSISPSQDVARHHALPSATRLQQAYNVHGRLTPAYHNLSNDVRASQNILQPALLSGSSTFRIDGASSSSPSSGHVGHRGHGWLQSSNHDLASRSIIHSPDDHLAANRESSSEDRILARTPTSASRVPSATVIQSSRSMESLSGQNSHEHNQRRVSEFVRRSLLRSLAAQRIRTWSERATAVTSPEDGVLSNGVADQRSSWTLGPSSWFHRHSDGARRISRSFQYLSGGSPGIIGNVVSQNTIYFGHPAFSADVEFHDQYGDMDLDVDNMSYEELLDLEEEIGDVCTGLSEKTIQKFLKRRKHIATGDSCSSSGNCCVCQEEYSDGERVATLDCNHDFHSSCIQQWLKIKNVCPICKKAALNTSENRIH